jgi:hypothetical protein
LLTTGPLLKVKSRLQYPVFSHRVRPWPAAGYPLI